MVIRNSNRDEMTDSKPRKAQPTTKQPSTNSTSDHWYSVPAPVRRIFDQFPVITYRANSYPQKARRSSDKNILYIFSNPLDTSGTNLSPNPACLKWQAYLKFNDIEFSTFASNNHASPSGSLPFLLPMTSSNEIPTSPLTTGKIPRWTSQQTMQEEDHLSMEHEAYMALIDQNLRNAWLYHLYLEPSNFDNVARPLYITTTSSNMFVQMAIAFQLRDAAQSELLKSRNIIDKDEIFAAATKAFRALSVLLGSNEFFSDNGRPNLFDASVFAYTHLLMDESLPWGDSTLSDILKRHLVLIDHRERLLNICKKS